MSILTHTLALKNERDIAALLKRIDELELEAKRKRGGRPRKVQECSTTQN